MRKAFLIALLACGVAMAPASLMAQAGGAQTQLCSNGPVVADWGGKLASMANTPEDRIFKEVRHELRSVVCNPHRWHPQDSIYMPVVPTRERFRSVRLLAGESHDQSRQLTDKNPNVIIPCSRWRHCLPIHHHMLPRLLGYL